MNLILFVILLGLVEGITEFLPISSTGHMILVDNFINVQGLSKNFMDAFLIIIQLGAILSVVVYFWNDINPLVRDKEKAKEKWILWSKIAVGVLPAVVLGLKFDDYISEYFLDNSYIVSIMLIIYGVLFLFVGKFTDGRERIRDIKNITYKTALLIGFFQCLAMIPGTSRSGATIIGGLILALSRPVAAEFSFFLAIPTMFGATLLKVVKNGLSFTSFEWMLVGIGSLVAFITAYIVIKWFMTYIKSKDFKIFGIYRVIVGVLVLILLNLF